MRSKALRSILWAVGAAVYLPVCGVWGHGFVGNRFFPATVTTDDPLVTDELALPLLSFFKQPPGDEGPATGNLSAGFELDKVIFPKLALGIEGARLWQMPDRGHGHDGWDNFSVTLKYELWRNDAHEAIVSVGLASELGGTGSKSIGRDAFSTFTPTLYLGKGLGDLPAALDAFRPIAVTGVFGQAIATESGANILEWGISLQYSLPYLQQHIVDIGLPEPLKNMIPLVEFSMETGENRGAGGLTTGTINPGVLWESRYFQVGVEALVPVNQASGEHVGVAVQLQIYIDDIFPQIFGTPLFGD